MTRRRAGLLALAALPLLAAEGRGCAADREVPVAVVRGGARCGGDAPSVRRLASPEALGAAFPAGLGEAAPSADFERAAVLLVAVGQRPTAGYGVELAAERAPVKDGVALVRVTVREPAAGAMVAQVVTSPCLVVTLPRAGLAEVKVADGAGALLGSVPLR